MQRVDDPSEILAWLRARRGRDEVSGFELAGWPESTWILHAMYENPGLRNLGTHDEWHRRELAAGAVAPLMVGDHNFDEVGVLTGVGLGFASRPGAEWERLLWRDLIERTGAPGPSRLSPLMFGV